VKAELKPRYKQSCEERDNYISFLNKIRDQPNPGSEEMQEILRDIVQLEHQTQDALGELKKAEEARRDAEEELAALEREAEELDKQEEEFFREQNIIAREVWELEAERDRLNSLYTYNTNRLQKLQRVNIYNDAFFIASDGHFGTINGLRLGSLREKRVEWPEINAAWGQLVLLMATIIQKLKLKINGYRLRPLGSMSSIEKISRSSKPDAPPKNSNLPLYFNEEFLNSLFASKRLDPGMVAFLDILKQVCEFVQSSDPDLRIPYPIEKDKIGDVTIRLTGSTYDKWTGACKHLLTDAKWALAFTATH
jgi:beclin 1